MKRTLTFAALLLSVAASAQKIDPQVVVTRDYTTSIEAAAGKAQYQISDPEGVKNFDIDFDYSVFETKYLGSYDFSPYLIEVSPETPRTTENTLFVRAGAGFTFRPELEFVWSPVLFSEKPDSVYSSRYFKRLRLNLYGSHNSYVGRYHDFANRTLNDIRVARFEKNKDDFGRGSDLNTKLGASICYDGTNAGFVLAADYTNLGSDISIYDFSRQHNVFDVSLALRAHPSEKKHFHYAVTGGYRTSSDNVYGLRERNILDTDYKAAVCMGEIFDMSNSILVDLAFDGSTYRSTSDTDIHQSSYKIALTPHYKFQNGPLDLDLGLDLSNVWASAGSFYEVGKHFLISPDITARIVLKEKKCLLVAKVDGDNSLGNYAGLVSQYHFLAADKIRNTRVPYAIKAGLSGNLFKVLDYNVYAQYKRTRDGILTSIVNDATLGREVTSLCYGDYWSTGFHADAAMNFKAVKIYSDVDFLVSDFMKDSDVSGAFLPARWKSYSSVDFTVSRRITIGADLEFRSSMVAQTGFSEGPAAYVIPHYENLGIRGEWKTARNLSVWVRGRNLLCQSIQYVPLYSEKGMSFTAGITYRF